MTVPTTLPGAGTSDPTTSIASGGSSGNSFLDYMNSLTNTSTSNLDPKPKINPQGQVDIYGLGGLSGQELFTGTSSFTGAPKGVPSEDGFGRRSAATGPTNTDTQNSYMTTDEFWKQLLVLQQTNPQAFIALQQGLYDSGYYGNVKPTDVRFGIASQKTKDALFGSDGAVTHYLQATQGGATVDSFNDWMNKQVAAAKADPYSVGNGGGSASASTGFKATSPADIQLQGDAESQSLLGHSMSAGDTSALVGDVQGAQQAAFDAGDVYQRSVTPQAVARQYVLQNNLPEYAQHQAESYMNVFANAFLSGNSARANTSIGDAAVGTSG